MPFETNKKKSTIIQYHRQELIIFFLETDKKDLIFA